MSTPMFDKTMRILAPLVGLALAGLLGALAASEFAAEESNPVSPVQPKAIILSFGEKGGLCAEGECSTSTNVRIDGALSNGSRLSEEDRKRAVELREAILEVKLDPALLVDCGASTYDGSDPYIKFPELDGALEQCQDLPVPAEEAFEELLALLQHYDKVG